MPFPSPPAGQWPRLPCNATMNQNLVRLSRRVYFVNLRNYLTCPS